MTDDATMKVILAYQEQARSLASDSATSSDVRTTLWAQVVAFQAVIDAIADPDYAESFINPGRRDSRLVDKGRCEWCGGYVRDEWDDYEIWSAVEDDWKELTEGEELELDRIVPKRLGGLFVPGNLRILCSSCHWQRHATPENELLTMNSGVNFYEEFPVEFWHPYVLSGDAFPWMSTQQLLEDHLNAAGQALRLRRDLDFMEASNRTKSIFDDKPKWLVKHEFRELERRAEGLSAEIARRRLLSQPDVDFCI